MFTVAVPNPALSSGKTMLAQSNIFSSVEAVPMKALQLS